MNKLFKRLGVTLLGFALAAGVGVGIVSGVKINQVNATDTTFTYTSKSDPTGITSSPTAGNYEASRGAQWSNNTGLTLTTSSSFSSVSSVKLVTSTNANDDAYSISCTVGGNNFGSTISMVKGNNQELEFTGTSATGVVQIKYTLKGTKKSIYVNSVTIKTGGTTTNYTVTFDANGHGTAPDPVVVSSGGKVTKPADPTASGFTFGGWYTEAECTNEYDFNTSVTSSFTLFAKWTAEGPTPTPGGYYEKVTSSLDDWTGQYLIVYEASSLAFNGSLTTLDATNNGFSVSISNNQIAANSDTESKYFTIGQDGSYWTIKSASGYYIGAALSNGLSASQTVTDTQRNSILYFNGIFTIKGSKGSGSKTLSFNTANDQKRFRYLGTTLIQLYKKAEVETKSLKSISTLSGTVSAKTGDTSWTISNVSVTGVLSDSPSVVDVSSYVNVSVVEAVPTIDQDGTMDVTLKATGKKETSVTKSVSVKATLSFINPYDLRQIYGSPDDTTVTIDGIYMGDVRDAMIIMDGEYGANIYYGTGKVPAHGYIPGVTTLTVTGTTTLYKGLEEVKPTSVVELIDEARINKLQVPQTYICTGNETSANPELASRKTHATGYVTAISDASGNKNVTLSVNDKSIAVFVGSVYATEEVMNELNASKDNQTNITIEGFTSFYNSNFQIQFTGLVKQKVDYLAENFAQDLLDLTDAVCEGYDGKTNNKDALSAVWLILQDADHYLGLVEEEQAKLVSAAASQTGTVIEKSMARYDYLAGKYGLTNFINRTITASSMFFNNSVLDNNTTMIVIISVAVASISLLGVTIFLKKKRATH